MKKLSQKKYWVFATLITALMNTGFCVAETPTKNPTTSVKKSVPTESASAPLSLQLNDKNYFAMPGLNVTVFSDIYPDGHQTGVTIIQHGNRVAANGDLRLEV